MEYLKTNVVLDEMSRASIKVQRPFSNSALIRWWLKLIFTTEAQWDTLLEEDEEVKAIAHYVAPKIRKALGIKKKGN